MKRTMNDEIHGREVSVRGKRIKLATGNKWKCYNGDSILVVKDVPDDSIGYQIMSPPFPEVYTYSDSPFDMGNNNYEEFWHHWGMLIPEQLRVSAPGRLCTIHAWDLPILKRDAGYTGLRDFPGEIIRHFVAAGWIFHARQTIWKDPVVENARTHSLGHGNLLKDSAKSRLGICDYLLTFQKPGENQDPIAHSRLDLPVWRWQKWASGCLSQNDLTPQELRWLREVPEWMSAPIWYDIAPGDTLQKTTAREEQDEKHICPLQLTAIRRAILMWSRPGDVVASWFGGIGSEGFVAVKEERQALLVELKESYWKMAVSNLKRAETFKQQLTLADLK
jgi:DNA modification methylase